MTSIIRTSPIVIVGALLAPVLTSAQENRFQALANSPFANNRPTVETAKLLKDELLFQRATQTYLWAMPLLNTMGMRDGFKDSFGTGYNVMAIWEKRLDAKTRITTPNSDLIYGMVFEDLSRTGPLVFEAPPKLQGILLDFWQRPIPVDGGKFFGDVGLPGPDGGAGGKFLLLPPGYKGDMPEGYYVYRSGTNNVFIFLRSFYQSLDNIQPAVDVLKQSVLYPLGKKDGAKKMEFKDASGKPHEMLPRTDATAFEQLKYLVDTEGNNLCGQDWLGMLAGLGIVKDKPFKPDAHAREILDRAARTAYKMSRVVGFQESVGGRSLRVYPDRQWVNPAADGTRDKPGGAMDLNWSRAAEGYRDLDSRIWFFTNYYSWSPGMISQIPGKGAKYLIGFNDADGDPLSGGANYRLHLPKDIPAANFWSLTLYEAENASQLDNGQPFPSLGKLNKPAANDDGSIDLYMGPKAPDGKEKNWLATPKGRGHFAILRLYAPTEPAINGSWKPGDIIKQK